MSCLSASVASAVLLGVLLPVFAGPDWDTIERARRQKAEREHAYAELPSAAGRNVCPPRLVLPLDHGPRALTTPQLNRLRQDRHDEAMKACKAASK